MSTHRGPRERRPGGERDAPTVVATHALTRDYGGTGLFDVELRVPGGGIYGLVGANGAGKTTLLSIITGVRRADSGSVELAVPRCAVAVCPDVPEFEPWLTAHEVVDLARSLVAPHLGAEHVARALAAAGLAGSADRRVGGFSRGMTQRLGLAAALVGAPRLLILDEPTSALDPAGRSDVLDLVSGLRDRATVIFSSHILADVQRVADSVGVLRDGHLVYQGTTRKLVETYLTPRWALRIDGDAPALATALRSEGWVRRVDVIGPQALRVQAASLREGQHGIPRALAAHGVGLIACEPLAADLEAAFLALTREAPGMRDARPTSSRTAGCTT